MIHKKIFFQYVLLSVALLLSTFNVLAQTHHDWSYNKTMYEVNIRQYTPEGTFKAFESHLDRLDSLGVGILWLMPIHPIGQQNKLGSLGSYYSVKDYLGINPNFGDEEDFQNLVDEIHSRGMYVLMDWVANHTSWDNNLTTEHPEWYVKDDQDNFTPPPGTNWSDVIQLDFSKEGLQNYMIDAQKYWVEEFGIDGFRYDAASFVPDAFWEKSNAALKQIRPDIFLLAEASGESFHEAGFDASFGWDLYSFGQGLLIRLTEGTASASNIRNYTLGQIRDYPEDAYRVYFTSTHDENSWEGTDAELFGEAASTFAVLVSTIHGIPLIYNGQEAGLSKRLAFFDKDQIPWRDHPNFELYRKLALLRKDSKALWSVPNGGLFQEVTSTNRTGVLSFVREKDEDKVLVLMNLTDSEQVATLSGEHVPGSYKEIFSEENVSFSSDTTLTFEPWEYRILVEGNTGLSRAEEVLPTKIDLHQNFPNPFNPTTTISFTLENPTIARIEIFDSLGRSISVIADRQFSSGNHSLRWNASGFPSGVYVYRFQAEGNVISRKMVLMK